MTKSSPSMHFKGKDAVGHVAETQAEGIIASSEIHGTELPGHLSAAADSARETALVLVLLWLILWKADLPPLQILQILAIFSSAWIVWKTGRSAWLGWSRLERLHRVLAEEKWEIEHHRQQEREELKVLYAAKGFEGKLLEDVLDVLMADGDRLLRVMIQEELGLSLESHEHPLKQSLGAAIGVLGTSLICCFAFWIYPKLGLAIAASLMMAASAAFSAFRESSRIIPAMVWNLGLLAVAVGFIYFLLSYFIGA